MKSESTKSRNCVATCFGRDTIRQKVTRPADRVLMHINICLKGITPETNEILWAGLLKNEAAVR